MSLETFYVEFENRHRGSRSLILDRLRVYLDFVRPLMAHYPKGRVVDLGCGRGEWLELMREIGLPALGVDVDVHMLELAEQQGLAVVNADALAYLREQPEASVLVVSGFHVAEHISFEALQSLVKDALRVLVPGGLLILETPNSENLAVATTNFYLDPTHQRPIPPLLMEFLPEYHGYARFKILRLQEAPELRDSDDASTGLAHVLFGASPDYALVAQSPGPAVVLGTVDDAFERNYGISTLDLALRHDRASDSRNAEAQSGLNELRAEIGQLSVSTQELLQIVNAHQELFRERLETLTGRWSEQLEYIGDATVAAINSELAHSNNAAEARHADLVARVDQAVDTLRHQEARQSELEDAIAHWRNASSELTRECDALRASLSWRVTAPLRILGSGFRLARDGGNSRSRLPMLKNLLAAAISSVLRNPESAAQINRQLLKFPWLHRNLRAVALEAQLMSEADVARSSPQVVGATPVLDEGIDRSHLPRSAQQILEMLEHLGKPI